MSLPLEGYTVVAIEQAVAAPLASRQLADLGARVIKVERPGEGDLARGYDHLVHGTASHFVWLNRGKESLAVDLKDPSGRDVVRRLIAEADVFLQNLAPGAAARLGFDAETLRRDKPELVVVNLSGYGCGGDMESRKAYDMLVQAEVGLVSITGTSEEAVKTGIPTADIASGMYCTQAVLAALLRRERTGDGATIEVTMFEATAEWMGHPMYVQLYANRQIPRMGLSHAAIAPYDAYPTVDGQILIGIQSDSGWHTLSRDVFGSETLASDPRFTTNVLRVENRAACDAAVAEHTSLWTTVELNTRLADAGVPAAQVSTIRDLVTHPQLRARRRWRTVETEGGRVEAPVTFDDVEAAMGNVPALGQHTRALIAESGISPTVADLMFESGAVAQHINRQPQEALS
jgi:itaconate CoA-transferase